VFSCSSNGEAVFPGHVFATVPSKHWGDAGEANGPSDLNEYLANWLKGNASFWDVERFRFLLDPLADSDAINRWGIRDYIRTFLKWAMPANKDKEYERLVDRLKCLWSGEV
jgi:hypothetical protein